MNAPLALRGAREHGMTMAELLVAMTLGLAVLLAAGALLAWGNQAWLAQSEAAAADDGGRYALDLIGRALRQAAYVDWERDGEPAGPGASSDAASPAAIGGLDDRSISKAGDGIANPLPGAVNGSDVLAVRFAGAGVAPDGDGSITSCAGFAVPAQAEGWSIFYVARNAQGEPELRCKYRSAGGWGADAVVAGVDSFQVLYGIDTDAEPDGVANRYLNASGVAALDAALLPSGASAAEQARDRLRRSHWQRVVCVKVALLLRGARAGQGAAARATYDLFGSMYGDAQGAIDRGTRLAEAELAAGAPARERRLFATTFGLRGLAPRLNGEASQ